MPTKVTDRFGQMVRYLNRIFLPSSPLYTTPDTLLEEIRLVQPALSPSLLYERTGIQFGTTVNPATQLFFPSVEGGAEGFGATQQGVAFGEFYWIIAARWSQLIANVSTGGRAWIALKNIGSTRELAFAEGFWPTGDTNFATAFLDTRSPMVANVTAPNNLGGGGQTAFVLPPGYCIHMSTAATPAATTTFEGVVHYCRCAIGELFPTP